MKGRSRWNRETCWPPVSLPRRRLEVIWGNGNSIGGEPGRKCPIYSRHFKLESFQRQHLAVDVLAVTYLKMS